MSLRLSCCPKPSASAHLTTAGELLTGPSPFTLTLRKQAPQLGAEGRGREAGLTGPGIAEQKGTGYVISVCGVREGTRGAPLGGDRQVKGKGCPVRLSRYCFPSACVCEASLVQCAERPVSLRSALHPAPLMTFPFPETHWASSVSRTILPRINPLPCVPFRLWWTRLAVVDKSSLRIPPARWPPLTVQRYCLIHLQAWRGVLVNLPHVVS